MRQQLEEQVPEGLQNLHAVSCDEIELATSEQTTRAENVLVQGVDQRRFAGKHQRIRKQRMSFTLQAIQPFEGCYTLTRLLSIQQS
jgi:hypothetical protein